MNVYLKEITKIEDDVFVNMGKASQKTIDIVQETRLQLDRGRGEDPILRDELGAISYQISILLEVWDKKLTYDIEVLSQLDKIVEEWSRDVVVLETKKH